MLFFDYKQDKHMLDKVLHNLNKLELYSLVEVQKINCLTFFQP